MWRNVASSVVVSVPASASIVMPCGCALLMNLRFCVIRRYQRVAAKEARRALSKHRLGELDALAQLAEYHMNVVVAHIERPVVGGDGHTLDILDAVVAVGIDGIHPAHDEPAI